MLDKPVGLTSNAALVRARRLLDATKAGHTGTLDPLASGLLPICFGEATKFSGFLLDADKSYEAEIELGTATDTGDAEGAVVHRADVSIGRSELESVLEQFHGTLEQTPPMFSALKHQGRPLYKYARAGEVVPRPARRVVVHELDVLEFSGHMLRIQTRVSKGTYIRTLAHDIGERIGCGAHIRTLRRTGIGQWQVQDAWSFEQLAGFAAPELRRMVRPVDLLVAALPRLDLAAPSDAAIRHGRNIVATAASSTGPVRLYDRGGAFIGVGEVRADALVVPRRLLAKESVGGPDEGL